MISQLRYVGIPKRFLALVIDGLIQTFLLFVLFLGVSQQQFAEKALSYAALTILIQWGYYCLMESSRARGTFGKLALGIGVCNTMGEQLSLRQATLRFLGKSLWALLFFVGLGIGLVAQASGNSNSPYLIVTVILMMVSLLILVLGYLMAAFTPERQALHDRIAQTYVIEDESIERSVPQKVIFQLMAIAIVSRLLFHAIPGVPTQTATGGGGTQSTIEQPVTPPTNTPRSTESDRTAQADQTSMRCGVTEQLSPPTPNSYIDGDWRVNFAVGVDVYQSVVRMKADSGVMRTVYFDPQSKRSKTVLQQMKLRVSANGLWLLGSNPINAENNQAIPTYIPDNIFIQRTPEGELVAFNCDNRNNLWRATIAPLTN